MDFGLFAHSTTLAFGTPPASPSPTPSVPPTGHDFNLGFLESKFFWWCVKLLFWSALVRDACFHAIPYIGGLIKSAIDKSFPVPDTSVDQDTDASESDSLERMVNGDGSVAVPAEAPKTKSRVKGSAYHYSSALESALGLNEGDVESEIRKGIDVLGDKAEEVVEGLAGSMLESLMGRERQHKE
jgi:hypothetical protein